MKLQLTAFATLLLLSLAPAAAQIAWTDVTLPAGVSGEDYFSSTGHSLGIVWIDFNLDDLPDLFLVGGDPELPPRLFRNDGDGTFTRVDGLLPSLPAVEMSGARFADYDRDGDPDLFIYTDNTEWELFGTENPPDGPANLLLRNLWVEDPSADPLFEDVTAAAGLEDLASPAFGELPAYRSKAAAWLDYDLDGCIDLYVGHLVLNEAGTEANKDRLYRNRCDGTFEDVSEAAGILPGEDPSFLRSTLVVGGFHLDADLLPDLYVVHVSALQPQPLINDFILRNQGADESGTVTFTEVTATMPGIGNDAQAGMGIDAADIDLDGDWDLYISDFVDTEFDDPPVGNVLYLGDGKGGFHDNSAPAAGVESTDSWGVNFFDADHDGWEDLFVGTWQKHFYHNQGIDPEGSVSFTTSTLPGINASARGSAVADYDRDGDLDIAVVHQGGPLLLLRNDTITSGHRLQLKLTGTVSNTDAIGTVVEATTGSVRRMRQVKGGVSAHSQDDPTVHFGLGEATVVDHLVIRWPSGHVTEMFNVPVDQSLDIVESDVFADSFESGDVSRWWSLGR